MPSCLCHTIYGGRKRAPAVTKLIKTPLKARSGPVKGWTKQGYKKRQSSFQVSSECSIFTSTFQKCPHKAQTQEVEIRVLWYFRVKYFLICLPMITGNIGYCQSCCSTYLSLPNRDEGQCLHLGFSSSLLYFVSFTL